VQLDWSLSSIEAYYGESISIYFEFFEFLQNWLIFPSFVGFCDFANDTLKFDFEHMSLLDRLYTILIVVWANIFIIFWQRKESELQIKWHSYGKLLQQSEK
jgi:hypothetical protein